MARRPGAPGRSVALRREGQQRAALPAPLRGKPGAQRGPAAGGFARGHEGGSEGRLRLLAGEPRPPLAPVPLLLFPRFAMGFPASSSNRSAFLGRRWQVSCSYSACCGGCEPSGEASTLPNVNGFKIKLGIGVEKPASPISPPNNIYSRVNSLFTSKSICTDS